MHVHPFWDSIQSADHPLGCFARADHDHAGDEQAGSHQLRQRRSERAFAGHRRNQPLAKQNQEGARKRQAGQCGPFPMGISHGSAQFQFDARTHQPQHWPGAFKCACDLGLGRDLIAEFALGTACVAVDGIARAVDAGPARSYPPRTHAADSKLATFHFIPPSNAIIPPPPQGPFRQAEVHVRCNSDAIPVIRCKAVHTMDRSTRNRCTTQTIFHAIDAIHGLARDSGSVCSISPRANLSRPPFRNLIKACASYDFAPDPY